MKKCKKRKKRVFLLFLALFFLVFITLYSISNKMLVKIGEASYQGVLSTASYYAINKTLSDKYNYSELFKVHKDSNGKITMITSDSYKFNVLTVSLAESVGEYMNNYVSAGVDVPIGVFTGIRLLQGFGKSVKMKLIVIHSVKCDVVSKFESAGINQTRHTLYLVVTPDASVVTRVSTKKIVDKITVMLYDNVIIGEVPEVYLASSIFSAQKYV